MVAMVVMVTRVTRVTRTSVMMLQVVAVAAVAVVLGWWPLQDGGWPGMSTKPRRWFSVAAMVVLPECAVLPEVFSCCWSLVSRHSN